MTTQMVVGVNPERKNNTTTNMAIGAGIGTVAGAAYGQFVPAKYNSFEALIEDATKGDKVELKELSSEASQDAKTVYNAAKEATEGYVADTKAVAELFKGDTKEVDVNEVINKLGLQKSTSAEKNAAKVAENIAEFRNADGTMKEVTEETAKKVLGDKGTVAQVNEALESMKVLTPEQEIAQKVAENIDKLKNTDGSMKEVTAEVAKDVLGDKGTVEQVNTALQSIRGNAETITDEALNAAKNPVKQITEQSLTEAKNVVSSKSAADTLVAQAKNGKVTQEVAMDAAKAKATAKEGLEKFAENAKIFGTGGLKNITKWGAIGLVVAGATAWVYSKFFGNKDAA